jgi:hypothetical protein
VIVPLKLKAFFASMTTICVLECRCGFGFVRSFDSMTEL